MIGSEPSILVIDHDQECRDFLRTRLQAQDYVVAEADTGELALAILKAEKFDFIIIDVNMSDVGSIQLIEHIKSDVRISETPIIVAGTKHQNAAMEECTRYGADERLFKPYDIVAVKSVLWKFHSRLNKGSHAKLSAAKPESAAVLVVDDNALNLDLVSRRLKGAGYHVVCASNGEQSLRLLKSTHYDVVLLDIMMPELSGIDVLKRIRSNQKTDQPSVIMFSALDDTANIQNCIQLGADDYLTKPFSSDALTLCIESQLRMRRERNDSRFHGAMDRKHD